MPLFTDLKLSALHLDSVVCEYVCVCVCVRTDFTYFRFCMDKIIRNIFMFLWGLFQNIQGHPSWLIDLQLGNCSFVSKYIKERWFNIIVCRGKFVLQSTPRSSPGETPGSGLFHDKNGPALHSNQCLIHSWATNVEHECSYLFLMRMQFQWSVI